MGGTDLPTLLVPPKKGKAPLWAQLKLTLPSAIAHLAPRSLPEDRLPQLHSPLHQECA